MAMSTLLTLVLALTWKIICETPFNRKNARYAQFFTSLAVVQEFAIAASLSFAPGLLEVMQASVPPTVKWFKNLPNDKQYAWETNNWAVYLLVLEKNGERTRAYVGSCTHGREGLATRWRQYDNKEHLPTGVEKAFEDGFEITHKGVLCWIPMPLPAKVLMYRLLILALECLFTYYFWTMRPGTHDAAMSYICPWPISSLEYDGIDSHGSLADCVHGNFDLTEEELVAHAEQRDERTRTLKAVNIRNYHAKHMELNYHDYMDEAVERVREWREDPVNWQRELDGYAARNAQAIADRKFVCGPCNKPFSRQVYLDNHYASEEHARTIAPPVVGEFKCIPCNRAFTKKTSLTRHNNTSAPHKKKVKEYAARLAAQSSS